MNMYIDFKLYSFILQNFITWVTTHDVTTSKLLQNIDIICVTQVSNSGIKFE